MAKLPVNLTKAKALLGAIATIVGPQVVDLLKDPARAEQLKSLAAGLGPALKARTPERRLTAKVDALRAQLDALQPGDAGYDRRESWRPRLAALEAKRSLIATAYTGRARSRQLKVLSRQVDDLLVEFLTVSDDAIRGSATD